MQSHPGGCRCRLLLVLIGLAVVSAPALGQTTPHILDAVRNAAPKRVDGLIPTYVSAGAERRARDLQAKLSEAATF